MAIRTLVKNRNVKRAAQMYVRTLQLLAAAFVLMSAALSAQATQPTSYYIYDESGHVIGEYDQNGNPVQEHIYLGDRPVAVVTGGSSSGGTVDYVTTDQLNTPRVITDGSGTSIWSWNSDPFGNGQPTGSLAGNVPYNLRFPGQYFDQESSNNYNYYRDYSPTIGRYVEPDPIGVSGVTKRAEDLSRAYWLFATGEKLTHPQLIEFPNLDIYSYTDQNPLNATDAKGET
jgi:RHS repeat-associated protein